MTTTSNIETRRAHSAAPQHLESSLVRQRPSVVLLDISSSTEIKIRFSFFHEYPILGFHGNPNAAFQYPKFQIRHWDQDSIEQIS